MKPNWRALARHGWRLCAWRESQALLMTASCLLMIVGAIMPERQRVQAAAAQLRQVRAAPARPEPVRLHAPLASVDAFPDALDRILKTAASNGLVVNEGAYTVTRESAGTQVRFHIVLPLHGNYPQVRGLLAALARDVPGVLLDNIQFERRDLADAALDVKLRLVLFLAQGELPARATGREAASSNVFAATSWKPTAPPAPAPAPGIVSPAPPSAPPLPFRFLGRYGDGDSQIIMLIKGEQLYLVAAGDTIDDAYRVERVSGSMVELTYLPLQIKQSLSTGDAG